MVFTQGVSSFSFGSHERVVSPSKQPFAVEVEHGSKRRIRSALLTGLTGAIATSPLVAMADDYEIAELPPPYVPVAVAVVLLGGVGVLTSSLGDVLAEGKLTTKQTLFIKKIFYLCLFCVTNLRCIDDLSDEYINFAFSVRRGITW